MHIEPVAPRSPVGKAKRKNYGTRILLGTVLATTLFYGASAYASTTSERYRDFFMQEVPGGEYIMTQVEDRQMDRDLVRKLSDKARRASGKAEDLQKRRAERMAEFARQQQEKAKELAAEAKETVQATTAKVADQAKTAAATVTESVKRASESVQTTVASTAQQAKAAVISSAEQARETAASSGRDVQQAGADSREAIKDAASKAKEAISDATNAVTPKIESQDVPFVRPNVPVDYQKPRQLDGRPQTPKVAPVQDYTGPPLPVGFQPPPGYAVPRPKVAKKPEAEQAPPPLPLVAPTVSEFTSSEPVLGQLASTIDNLSRFLNDSPSAVGDKGAREVLTTATLDLRALGERLGNVKEEERKKLEVQIEEKTREYSANLHEAERELVQRLEKQEDDWKSAFEIERKSLVDAYRQKLDGELAGQKELIEQRLQEEIVAQGIEMQRRWLREVKERVETERAGRLGKLENLQSEIQELGKTTLENSSWLDDNREVNKLWTAIRAAYDTSLDNRDSTPFFREVTALKNVSAKSPSTAGDAANAVETVLNSVPEHVQQAGIDTFPTLAAWFSDRIVPQIRKASLLPANGGFLSYLASSTFSNLLFQRLGFVQGEDVISTLSRAEWHLTHRDLESAAREVNQLTGWPKILARDWLESARRHLEVRQALQIAEAEAGLASLLIL